MLSNEKKKKIKVLKVIVGVDSIHMSGEEAMIGNPFHLLLRQRHRWKTESVDKITNRNELISIKSLQTASLSLFLLVDQQLV